MNRIHTKRSMSENTPHALVIVFDGIEEIEALTPVDILRRAEIEVTVATLDGQATVTGRNQITFAAETSLSLLDTNSFDLVLLPGGPGVLELLDHDSLRDLLLQQDSEGKQIAAICAAPKVLAQHGLLSTRQATSHISVRKDLPNPSDAAVVADGHITTSQGLGTAVEFSLSLVRSLKGEDLAQQIADSIHFSPKA
ncbi:DJ-1 family glyoxalase III [Pelagicoccus mobilis]|uniref:DJ-1/PfpI family protein n=1 Tax=Pelagicoccus mobilis TaxID=415221 RepID=A0A934S082_9BACT|nr:DJ-1 family glyoxalase III [Pelagicoccus mobilis]MBK1879977.1 DJ-1/PfpI family protein [Pelagicoccus mobilis]